MPAASRAAGQAGRRELTPGQSHQPAPVWALPRNVTERGASGRHRTENDGVTEGERGPHTASPPWPGPTFCGPVLTSVPRQLTNPVEQRERPPDLTVSDLSTGVLFKAQTSELAQRF